MQHHPLPSILHRKTFRCWPQGTPWARKAQDAVLALGDHVLGTAAGCPPYILCHSAPKDQPRAVTPLSGCDRTQAHSPETAPITPSVPELMSMTSCREGDQGLDLSGYKPFYWGIRGLISAAAAWRKAKVKLDP